MRGGELETLHLVQDVTEVPIDLLAELMPTAKLKRTKYLVYDPRLGALAWREQVQFGKKTLSGNSEPVMEDTTEHRQAFVREFSKWAHGKVEQQVRALARFHKRVPIVPLRQVESAVKRFSGIVSLDQLHADDKRALLSLTKLETYVDEREMERLYSRGQHHAHRKSHKKSPGSRRKFSRRDHH
jgi:hypothetical protein